MLRELNWIDWIIVAVVAYYVIEGWEQGLVLLLANLASFLGALWLAIKYHGLVGNFLVSKFGLPALWTNVASYLIVALVGEIVLTELLRVVLERLPAKIFKLAVNQWLGAIVSAINSLILIAFFLLIVLSLPLRGTIKSDIKVSKFGSVLVRSAERYGGNVRSSLDEINKFLTVEPQSNERISLDVAPKSSDLAADPGSEQTMVTLVNNERRRVGLGQLRVDSAMISVARKHSLDMFVRRYFSHIDPEGHDAAYRMEQAGIDFTAVGENLAYAPDVTTAHQGLINSEGHRRNILDPQFHRIGIGIINGGVYGEMFTQLFAD